MFYKFLKKILFKAGLAIFFTVTIVVLLDHFFIDINETLNILFATYSPQIIYSLFLLSETFLGLLPPEIFIAWSSKSATPWLFIIILATISYIAGIFSHFIGRYLFLIPAIKYYIEHRIAKHIVNIRKWGSFFIIIGAVSPIPHSIISMASGLIRYNFKHYLLWSLFRYLRFIIYALIIFRMI